MIKKFTIYGERCSGTNYLEDLITKNFDVQVTWEYGWKHFFGFNDLQNSDDTLFIGIIRNPFKWLNSLYREKHHLPPDLTRSVLNFLTKEFYSLDSKTGQELATDKNIYTKRKYKNIFEMRYTKLHFLQNDMPHKVKNYIFIRYEDLKYNFEATMNAIKNTGLVVKKNISFPLNSTNYKNTKNMKYDPNQKKMNNIPYEIIMKGINTDLERKLGYIK